MHPVIALSVLEAVRACDLATGDVPDDPHAGQEAINGSLHGIALQIIGTDANGLRPFHLSVNSWQTQTTLLLGFIPLGQLQFRIDQHQFLAAVVSLPCRVGDKHPQRKVHLVGGESDAFGFVHQFKHLSSKVPQLVIDAANRLGANPQRWMGIGDDAKLHGASGDRE